MIWPGLRPLISPLQCVRVQWYWVVNGVRDVVVSIGINVEACKNGKKFNATLPNTAIHKV